MTVKVELLASFRIVELGVDLFGLPVLRNTIAKVGEAILLKKRVRPPERLSREWDISFDQE